MSEVSRKMTAEVSIHHEASQELVMKVKTQVFDVFHSKIRNSMAVTNIANSCMTVSSPYLDLAT